MVHQILGIEVGSGNFQNTANWNQGTHVLTLIASGSNAALSIISVNLPSTLGVQLPLSGLQLNQQSLEASCNASAGPVLTTGIPSTDSVGVISEFSLSFWPRTVSTPTSIIVSMVLSADLEPQNKVELVLPNFRGASASHLNFSASTTDGNPLSLTGRWDLATTTLMVQLKQLANRNKPFGFVVDASSNLQLPVDGIQVNHSGFFVSTNATNGQVTSLAISAHLVSVLTSQKIDFSSAAARMPCGINFSFSLACRLAVDDTLLLKLPGFTGSSIQSLNLMQMAGGANFTGSWQPPLLSLTVRESVASNSIQWVSVGENQGITVAESGVPLNSPSIDLTAIAACGAVDHSPFPSIRPIGAFRSTSLEILPHVATPRGTAVGLKVHFAPMYPISNGDVIFLLLPGFRGVEVASLNISTESGSEWQYSGSFAPGTPPVLRLTAAGPASAMQHFIVHIRLNNDISLPEDGLSHNQTSLMIGSTASLGPSVGQPVLLTPAVGVFTFSSLYFGTDFADSRANTTSSIQLKFVYNKDIQSGETVTMQLPMFSGASMSSMTVSSNIALTATWDVVSYAITMTFNASLRAGVLAEVYIPDSNGIVLPIRGVEANQTQITLATDASEGISNAVPVLFTEPVGAFLVSSLNFKDAAATMPAQIILSCIASFRIEVGDMIVLTLPLFYGSDVTSLNISSMNFNGSWSTANTTILLTASRCVPSETPTVIKIEALPDIRMPARGVAPNESAILLSSLARQGPTLGVSFQSVSPIGAFLSSELKVFPRVATVAGVPVGLSIRFRLNKGLTVQPGEVIFLALPGFRGHINGTYPVFCDTVGDYIIRIGPLSGQFFRTFSCSWSITTGRLSFVANAVINDLVDITIPKQSLLSLPRIGSTANSSLYLLGTNAALGPSIGQQVETSPAIGSFEYSSITFLNARAGGLADMQLNFTLMNIIVMGESVTFTLPDFSGPVNISAWTLRQRFNFTVDWSNAAKTLKMTFLHTIAANTLVHVRIPDSSNIKLPDRGIHDDHIVTVETDAQSGAVEAISVLSIPSVGMKISYYVQPVLLHL